MGRFSRPGFDREDSERPRRPTSRRRASTSPTSSRRAARTIFAVAAGRLHAVEAGRTPRPCSARSRFPGFGHELLLSGERLLVLSHDYAGGAGRAAGASIDPAHWAARGDPHRGRRRATRAPCASCARSGSAARYRERAAQRRHGARDRLLARPAGLAEEELRPRLAGWVPRATAATTADSGRRSTRRLTGCRQVRRARAYSGVDMLTVLTIDMSKGLPAVDSDALMTSAEIVYASPRSLYVATQRWVAEPDSPDRPARRPPAPTSTSSTSRTPGEDRVPRQRARCPATCSTSSRCPSTRACCARPAPRRRCGGRAAPSPRERELRDHARRAGRAAGRAGPGRRPRHAASGSTRCASSRTPATW